MSKELNASQVSHFNRVSEIRKCIEDLKDIGIDALTDEQVLDWCEKNKVTEQFDAGAIKDFAFALAFEEAMLAALPKLMAKLSELMYMPAETGTIETYQQVSENNYRVQKELVEMIAETNIPVQLLPNVEQVGMGIAAMVKKACNQVENNLGIALNDLGQKHFGTDKITSGMVFNYVEKLKVKAKADEDEKGE